MIDQVALKIVKPQDDINSPLHYDDAHVLARLKPDTIAVRDAGAELRLHRRLRSERRSGSRTLARHAAVLSGLRLRRGYKGSRVKKRRRSRGQQ
jgi:hypothetical protein